MTDQTPVAMRLAAIAIEKELSRQWRKGITPMPIAHMIEKIARGLDDAGVREAVNWMEEGLLSDERGKDDCIKRALSALSGTSEVNHDSS